MNPQAICGAPLLMGNSREHTRVCGNGPKNHAKRLTSEDNRPGNGVFRVHTEETLTSPARPEECSPA